MGAKKATRKMAKRRPAAGLASRTNWAIPAGARSRPRQGSDFPRLVSASEQNIALEGRNIVRDCHPARGRRGGYRTGEWRDGDWADFNPVAAPRRVESASD